MTVLAVLVTVLFFIAIYDGRRIHNLEKTVRELDRERIMEQMQKNTK